MHTVGVGLHEDIWSGNIRVRMRAELLSGVVLNTFLLFSIDLVEHYIMTWIETKY
jgi:hypothetical protein